MPATVWSAGAPVLDGRLAVVTGASSPVGRDVAGRLAAAGAEVIRAAADAPGALAADPAAFSSIDRLADELLSMGRPIDLLVAADELVAPPGQALQKGMDAQMAYNAVANAVLVSRLVSALRSAEAGRFVVLGSAAHQLARPEPDDLGGQRTPHDPWRAYAASKTAAGLVALQLFRALADEAYSTAAASPGCLSLAPDRLPLPPLLAAAPSCDEDAFARRGGAALFWAATAPEAFARYGYVDGAGPSVMLKRPNGATGHMPHIGDVELADRLWAAMERHLDRALPLDAGSTVTS